MYGLEYRVQGLGFWIEGFNAQGPVSTVQGLWFRGQWFMVYGFRVYDLRVIGLWFMGEWSPERYPDPGIPTRRPRVWVMVLVCRVQCPRFGVHI